MKTFISILRGINVSGQKKILMADLKKLYEDLEMENVTTYIQSGNVLFKYGKKASDIELASKIEKAIQKKYKFDVPVIIRSIDEWQKTIKTNPFLKEKGIDTDKLHVTFLSEEPSKAALEKIKSYSYPPDRFIISGKEVFLHVPESYGETKLSNKFFETKLEVSATTRNWKTVNKLMELTSEL